MRDLAPGLYAARDLRPGDRYATPGLSLGEWHVLGFAGLTGDVYELHTDERHAQDAGFPGRVAHGILGLALLDGLKNRAAVRLAAIASLGWTWDFRAPLLIGDRVCGEVAVKEVRRTSRPERAVVRLPMRLLKEDGTVAQEGENRLLMHWRAPTP